MAGTLRRLELTITLSLSLSLSLSLRVESPPSPPQPTQPSLRPIRMLERLEAKMVWSESAVERKTTDSLVFAQSYGLGDVGQPQSVATGNARLLRQL